MQTPRRGECKVDYVPSIVKRCNHLYIFFHIYIDSRFFQGGIVIYSSIMYPGTAALVHEGLAVDFLLRSPMTLWSWFANERLKLHLQLPILVVFNHLCVITQPFAQRSSSWVPTVIVSCVLYTHYN